MSIKEQASSGTIAFTGGGTGGHVYPAKPIIDSILSEKGSASLFWIGSVGGMEEAIVKGWGITYHGIPSGKLRRYFDLKNFSDFFRIIAGFFAARRLLRKKKPEFLFSKGGFVSVPPVLAARSLEFRFTPMSRMSLPVWPPASTAAL